MRRLTIVASQVAIDLSVLALAFATAFALRFDGRPPTDMVGRLALTVPYVVLGEYVVLVLFGVRRFSWRFIGLREVGTILLAVSASFVGLLVVRLTLGELQHDVPYLRHGVVPIGVLGANVLLAFLGVSGVRVARRLLGERVDRGRRPHHVRQTVPTLLVGAGQCGLIMARELASRPDLGIEAVGFVDDDEAKIGTVLHGVKVLGRVRELERHALERGARQVLVTIASASGPQLRDILARAKRAGLPAKIVPGLWELADGSVNVSRIRSVAIEDLLGRAPVELDRDAIERSITGRVVLVTGAGGSIGSEICRQVLRYRPAKLLLIERAENALFNIHRELLRAESQAEIVPLIADVCDQPRIESILATFRPEVVLHAAAHKHVPMMEENPGEALKNNVGGSALMARLAHDHGVERFVMISTDKAVNPSSVMGATKRLAEMFVQSLSALSSTRFVTVRFGNVLGSAGSVIPIFQEQIRDGGPVTVTHPEMRRYFMTIPEACQLVLQAGAMGEGGEIFVLDMGEPVKIVDLARDLISLSGLRPGDDIDIRFTGVRAGEKLFEQIATDAEQAEKTKHPKIFIGKTQSPPHSTVSGWLEELAPLLRSGDPARCRAFLRRVVPEYEPGAGDPLVAPRSHPPALTSEAGSRDLAASQLTTVSSAGD